MNRIDMIKLGSADNPSVVDKAKTFCDNVSQGKKVYTLRVGSTVYQTTVREHYEAWLNENRHKIIKL